MPPVVIENPIINSPFAEPHRHFRFGPDGMPTRPDSISDDSRNLIVEVSGAAKAATAAGPSSKSATRGTRGIQFEQR